MLQLVLGRAGSGKTHTVYAQIQALAGQGADNLVLIVPEQSSFETERDMLRLLGPARLHCVEVLSFTRLCDRFFTLYGGADKPVINATGRTVLMELALQTVAPQLELFRRQTAQPQFARQMLSLFEQTRHADLPPEKMLAASENTQGILKSKLYESALILSEYETRLHAAYYDPLDGLSRVAKALPSHPFFAGKRVFIDGFKGFTAQQLSVLEPLFAQAAQTVVTLGADALSDEQPFSPFANVRKTGRQLQRLARQQGVSVAPAVHLTQSRRYQSQALAALERGLFAPDAGQFDNPAEQIGVYMADTIYDEADFAAKTIHRLVREQDFRYRDFAVITRDLSRYSGVIDRAFEKRGVPFFLDVRAGVQHKAVFRLVHYALAATQGMDANDMLMLLKTGLTDCTPEQAAQLDNYVTMWEISGDGWLKPWQGNPAGLQEAFGEAQRQQLRQLNVLREKVIQPLLRLQQRLRRKTVLEKSKAVYQYMRAVHAGRHLLELGRRLQERGELRQGEEELRSYDLVIGVLDQLCMAAGSMEVSCTRYGELFDLAAQSCDLGLVPQKADEVMIGSAERIRPRAPKVTFVIGANEGIFPRMEQPGGIFTDAELQKLEQSGLALQPAGIGQLAEEQYLVYTALCSPSQRLYLTCAGRDLSGAPLEPSSAIYEVLELFDGLEIRPTHPQPPDAAFIETQDDALEILTDRRLTGTTLFASVRDCLRQQDPALYDRLQTALRGRSFQLSKPVASRLFGRNMRLSASKTDTFYKCPFQYFCRYGLQAKPLKRAQLDVLSRGSLVHMVLEKLLARYQPAQLLALTDQQLQAEISALTATFLSELTRGRACTGTERFYISQLEEMLVQLCRRIFTDLAQTAFVVSATELAIGADGVQPLRLVLPDGGVLTVEGAIDRVDTYTLDGRDYLRIIDYKTGHKELRLADVVNGQNMQMLLYMMALLQQAQQQGRQAIPAGMYYLPARDLYFSGGRQMTDEQISAQIEKTLKMTGITLNDPAAVLAMEPGQGGRFAPVALTAAGQVNGRSFTYTQQDFTRIAQQVQQLLLQMGQALHDGEIRVAPTDPSEAGKTACDYCDYRAVCGRDPMLPNQKVPAAGNQEVAQALEQLEQEETGDGL